ncbi:DUF2339 domain-containing protein (plasmid) [Bosea sp. F3-2]|uniref:DUF2339 domain-containing protein n=1 Tax=Bosea sp. F3-2 TaxID=2599640 RepID=UPI0011EBE5CB|nr:DUF2339 domain-containing protein [Bosea sp. F3-2]QEL26912.1 DUF2339 domain-containing protein [Bosea sp. F3-2]
MEWVIFGILAGLFFFIVVPWAAFAASGRSRQALEQVGKLHSEIAWLRSELATLKASGITATSGATQNSAPIEETEEQPPTITEQAQIPAPPVPPPPLPIDVAADEPPIPALVIAETDEPETRTPISVAARISHEGEDIIANPPPPPPFTDQFAQDENAETARVSRPDIEETIGSRWAVWIGGIALAFGGLFLIRYSIEAGMFGPGVRLLMGATFAVLLAAASEYLRRTEAPLPFQVPSNALTANIPAILAGVSVLAGFGVVFAAHAIYGFIGPTPAFVLMALIGLAALGASVIHGPALGLFGLIGSYATPLLISSTAPAFASLSLFITFVTATAFLLHIRRPSTLLTLAAVSGHAAWTALIAFAMQGLFWPSFLLIAGATLALLLIKEIPSIKGRQDRPWSIAGFDLTSIIAIAVPVILAGVLWVGFGGPTPLNVAIIFTVAIGVIAAARHQDLAPLAPLSAAGSVGMILLWPTQQGPIGLSPATVVDLIRLTLAPNAAPGLNLTAAAFGLIAGAIPFAILIKRRWSGAGGYIVRGCLAFSSALALVCLLLATALRTNGFERSLGFAGLATLLTAVLFVASELLLTVEKANTKSRRNPLALIASSAYAAAGAIALGMAVAFALRETWLAVGFSISAAGLALLAKSRPIPLLRTMSASLATAAIARWIWQPILSDMGSWPILNWLIPAYALPALCFAVGAIALRGRQDRPRIIHQALAAFFGAAFILLQVHQAFVGPNLAPSVAWVAGHYLTPRNWLFEDVACLTIALGFLCGVFQLLGRAPDRATFRIAAIAAAALMILLAVGGLGGLFNPLFDGTAVNGWPILNRLLWYVAAGAVLGSIGYRLSADHRSPIADAISSCAVFLVSLGAVLMVRQAFAGPRLVPVDANSVGYFEAIMITIVLLALTVAAHLWNDIGRGAVARFAVLILGFLAVAWAALTIGLARNPFLDGSGVFGPVIFNRILWGYGAIAVAFAAASWWLKDQLPQLKRGFSTASKAAALMGAFLLIRHGFHGAYLVSDVPITLAESGVYASLGLLAAIGLMIAGSITLNRTEVQINPYHVAIASCGLFAVLAFVASPIATDEPLAGILVLDNALIGYLMPSALAFIAARWTRAYRPSPAIERTFGLTAIVGTLTYVLVEVRRAFVGPNLVGPDIGASELYAYSAAILVFGVALLALGFKLRSRDLRLASLGVVTIAISKAFLVDMSGLEGLLRALSFIGLGGCLVAIGLAYQRLLRKEIATTEKLAN